MIRSLGRHGVPVTFLGDYHERFVSSRYCDWTPMPRDARTWEERVLAALLGPKGAELAGAVLLPCDDPSAEVLAREHEALGARYRLPLSEPAAQLCLLDKLCTYRRAREAGVPTPRFWPVEDGAAVDAVAGELVFPLIVKPLDSIRYQKHFGGVKHREVHDAAAAREVVQRAREADLSVMLVERIPGPDSRLRSYYTWIDEQGEPRVHFTKRLLRRSPPGMGVATFHVTDWIPEIRDPALRLLRHVGLRGMAQVEFIHDDRDGVDKLIECNVRFTQPMSLITAAGIDLPWIVYRQAAGLPYELPRGFRQGVRLWDPQRDLLAYRQMHDRGEITLVGWLRTLRPARLDSLSLSDPMPSLVPLGRALRRRAGAILRRGGSA